MYLRKLYIVLSITLDMKLEHVIYFYESNKFTLCNALIINDYMNN